MHMYACNFCGAHFKDTNSKKAIELLREHQENCTEENPYYDDTNAYLYPPN